MVIASEKLLAVLLLSETNYNDKDAIRTRHYKQFLPEPPPVQSEYEKNARLLSLNNREVFSLCVRLNKENTCHLPSVYKEK